MSKPIKMTEEYTKQLLREFSEALKGARLTDGKISFSKSVSIPNRKAKLYFTETAWVKMKLLVYKWDKEIAWHGIAKRNGKDKYTISDILIYPQEVTGATVTTNQREYETWLMNFDDDIFNNIRMQGHSHVNMGVTPSGVDRTLYDRILDQLGDDMFYIFLIWNKSDERTVEIYDFAENIVFETQDVEIEVVDEKIGTQAFLSEANEKVSSKRYSVFADRAKSFCDDIDDFCYDCESYFSRPRKKKKSLNKAEERI